MTRVEAERKAFELNAKLGKRNRGRVQAELIGGRWLPVYRVSDFSRADKPGFPCFLIPERVQLETAQTLG